MYPCPLIWVPNKQHATSIGRLLMIRIIASSGKEELNCNFETSYQHIII